MSQHFQYKHPEVSYNEKKQLRAAAKIAPGRAARKKARLPLKQLTLHLVLDESAEEREKVRGADEPKSGGNGRESEGDGKSKHNEKRVKTRNWRGERLEGAKKVMERIVEMKRGEGIGKVERMKERVEVTRSRKAMSIKNKGNKRCQLTLRSPSFIKS